VDRRTAHGSLRAAAVGDDLEVAPDGFLGFLTHPDRHGATLRSRRASHARSVGAQAAGPRPPRPAHAAPRDGSEGRGDLGVPAGYANVLNAPAESVDEVADVVDEGSSGVVVVVADTLDEPPWWW